MKTILLNIVLLSLILHSCKGQKDTSDVENKTPEKENTPTNYLNTHNSLLSYDSDNQICQVVRTMFQDSQGIIWFGTEDGAFKLAYGLLSQIKGIKSEAGKEVTIRDIAEGKDGKIWFGHTDGLSSIDGTTVKNYYESDGLISNDVWSIAADAKGNVWAGTIEGVCIFNGQDFSRFELPEGEINPDLVISSTKIVHNITEDSKGVIWLSSNAGLFSYADARLSNVSEKVGIQTNFVNEIVESSNGEFWISTKKALYRLKGDKLENITKDKIEIGKGIGSIAEDAKGHIWFTANQHQLYTFREGKIIEYEKSEGNKGPVIFQIYREQNNRLWFVGFGGAYRMENGSFVNITKNGPW